MKRMVNGVDRRLATRVATLLVVFLASSPAFAAFSGYYRILARHSGKGLNVNGASTADGANVQQWSCRGSYQQQWKLVSVGTGIYNLRPRHSGKCLDVAGASTADGANIQQWSCRTVPQQQWRLELVGGTCTPESNSAFCGRLGKNCGTVTAADNCGVSRSVACGSCTSPQTCGGGGTPNVCGGGTSTGFRHPGVLVNRAQLDLIRSRALAGTQPTRAGYDKARTSTQASLSWTPRPRSIVECGPSSNPNYGCSDERGDAAAAFTHALLWTITRTEAHAKKAIEIMNAWARVLTSHIGHNAPLQTGWAGTTFGAAAELIRHTYPWWASADVERFKAMLRNAYLPTLLKGSNANGNWELIMINAATNISVFLDDKTSFDKALAMWRKRVPAYIYLTTDGAYPNPIYSRDTPSELISFWYGQTTFVDGLAQETCRDFGHTMWGIAAAINTAETARQQGINLYGEQSRRLRAGLEFHADYLLGKAVPSWLCGGSLSLGNIPTWEIAYNHFNTRLGLSLPLTKRMIEEKVRPTGLNYFIAWETLTHAMTGSVGLP